jgi:hypothetical protein
MPCTPPSWQDKEAKMRKTMPLVLAGAAALLAWSRPVGAASFSPNLVTLQVGAGIQDFARNRISDNSTIGGAWDVRLVVGTRTPLALEAAYTGALQAEHDPFAPDPKLSTTQITGSARWNIITRRVQPFLGVGLGWVNFHSYGRDQTIVAAANFEHDANGVLFPFSGGLAFYLGRHGVLEARGSYSLVTGARAITHEDVRPDLWSATLAGGYAF